MSLKQILVCVGFTFGLLAASLVDFILLETIKKTLVLNFRGQTVVSESITEENLNYKIKYKVDGQDYFILEQKKNLQDLFSDKTPQIYLIFDKKIPERAITSRSFKFINSFLAVYTIGFILLTFGIYVLIKKFMTVVLTFLEKEDFIKGSFPDA